MTDLLLPLKVDGKKLRAPRRTPPRGSKRPTWTDYKVKNPVRCDHCLLVALESNQAGEGFDGLRDARRSRKQDGQTLLLCHEHAALQKERDDDDYGHLSSEGRAGKRRYLS